MLKYSGQDSELAVNTSRHQNLLNNTLEAQRVGWHIEFLAHAIEQANIDIEYYREKAMSKELTVYEAKILLSAEHFMYRVVGVSPGHLKEMRDKYAVRRSKKHFINKLDNVQLAVV